MEPVVGRGGASILHASLAKHGFGKLFVVLVVSLAVSLGVLFAAGDAGAKVRVGFTQSKVAGGAKQTDGDGGGP